MEIGSKCCNFQDLVPASQNIRSSGSIRILLHCAMNTLRAHKESIPRPLLCYIINNQKRA